MSSKFFWLLGKTLTNLATGHRNVAPLLSTRETIRGIIIIIIIIIVLFDGCG